MRKGWNKCFNNCKLATAKWWNTRAWHGNPPPQPRALRASHAEASNVVTSRETSQLWRRPSRILNLRIKVQKSSISTSKHVHCKNDHNEKRCCGNIQFKWRNAKFKNRFALSMTPYALDKTTLLWILEVSQKNHWTADLSWRIFGPSLSPMHENKLTCNLNSEVCKRKSNNLFITSKRALFVVVWVSSAASAVKTRLTLRNKNESTCLTVVRSITLIWLFVCPSQGPLMGLSCRFGICDRCLDSLWSPSISHHNSKPTSRQHRVIRDRDCSWVWIEQDFCLNTKLPLAYLSQTFWVANCCPCQLVVMKVPRGTLQTAMVWAAIWKRLLCYATWWPSMLQALWERNVADLIWGWDIRTWFDWCPHIAPRPTLT